MRKKSMISFKAQALALKPIPHCVSIRLILRGELIHGLILCTLFMHSSI